MGPLIRRSKKTCTVLVIISFMALMCGGAPYSVAQNGYEQRNGNGSTSMAPGYLNVDKARAEAIKENAKPKKTQEELIEKIDDDLKRSIDGRTTNEVKPDLKKKSGSEDVSDASTVTVVTETVIVPVDNALVEQALGEIAENEGVEAGAIDYAALTSGNTVFSWVKNGELRGIIYNEEGKATSSDPFSIAKSGPINNDYCTLTALEDDKFVASYYYNNDKNTRYFQSFNSEGILTGETTLTGNGNREWYGTRMTSIVALKGGGFAAAWGGNTESYQYFNSPFFQRFGSDCRTVGSRNYLYGSYIMANPTLSTLTNGNIAVVWGESRGRLRYGVVYGSSGYWRMGGYVTGSSSSEQQYAKVYAMSNGNFLITWLDHKSLSQDTYTYQKLFSIDGWAISESQKTTFSAYDSRYRLSGSALKPIAITEISGGDFVVTYYKIKSGEGYYAKVFDASGEAKQVYRTYENEEGYPQMEGGWWEDVSIALKHPFAGQMQPKIKVHALGDGTFGINWKDSYTGESYTSQYTTDGSVLTQEVIRSMQPKTTYTRPSANSQNTSLPNTSYYNKKDQFRSDVLFTASLGNKYGNPVNIGFMSVIFKKLLAIDKADMLGADNALGDEMDPAFLAELLESVFIVPIDELTPQEIGMAVMLINILSDPTAEQKVMIDALVSLMNEVQKIEEETGSEELKQTSDDFTQMVATVLLAQALPDLLKAGEISSIKGIFGELDSEKSKILLEYHTKANGYYQNIVKELAANIVTLQLKEILAKSLTERELEKLPAQHIDEIIKRIRNQKDKTITEEQILKVEAKYREEYLAPAKRILEENMKTLLQGFTQRLFSVLNEAGIIKEKMAEEKPVFNADLSLR